MQTVFQDIRFALHQFRKSRGFIVVAILTLALGVGANTAIYSVIHGALRLPYPESGRMIAIQNVYPQGSYFAVSYPDFLAWRDANRSFSSLVARFNRRLTWTGNQEPRSLDVALVTRGYFEMYGLRPVAGRGFLPSEHQKGAVPVCALSEDFWRETLHSDPGAVGRSMSLDGKTCTVVGVIPVMLPSGKLVQVWMPLEPNPPYVEHGTNFLMATGLLKPGATLAAAQTELATLQSQIDKQFPDNKHGVSLQPLAQAFFGDLRSVMNILQAAVGFILLIACVNLANMLLARAADREREFAIRRALGASPLRMLRQSLTESLLLSVAGAAAGLAVAVALTHIPIAAWPKGFVPPADVHLDGTILAFTCLLALLTGVLFGLVPALRILRQDETSALKQGRTVTESREQNRTRSALIIAEIALSMLLVAGSLNMALYFIRLMKVDPGVNPGHTLAMTVSLSPRQYDKPADQRRFFDALSLKLAALPGVKAVGAGIDVPFTGATSNGGFQYEGQPSTGPDNNPFADLDVVTPGYFAAVQTPFIAGRDFTLNDKAGSPLVVIINQSMARKLWPGQSALGKHINQGGDSYEVVGVVADVRSAGPATPVTLQIYRNAEQQTPPALTFILRTAGEPLAMAEAARHAVSSIDPGQAVSNVTSLEVLAQESVAGQRTSTMVTAALGCLALLLASIGVYGVMAYSVSRRKREFGVRMALGANRGNILTLLFFGVFRLVTVGMIAGIGLAIVMRTWVGSMLGSSGTSPAALIFAGLLLCLVASFATYIPARRAMRIEPNQALRTE